VRPKKGKQGKRKDRQLSEKRSADGYALMKKTTKKNRRKKGIASTGERENIKEKVGGRLFRPNLWWSIAEKRQKEGRMAYDGPRLGGGNEGEKR